MDNKKLKIIALILAIIAIGLITYVVCDISNKSEEELNYGNKEPNNEINNSDNKNDIENEEDNQSTNNKYLTDEDYDFDYDLEKCKEKYESYYINTEIYKIKVTNPSGAKVYDSPWEKEQKIINTVEYGKELSVVGDIADKSKIKSYDKFDEIIEDYYIAINLCGNSQYIKYNDVEIVDNSISNYKTYDKTTKFYVYEEEYLYSGPGLSFEEKNVEYKVPKGTILSADKYIKIGSAEWAYVNFNGKKRWLLKAPAQPVNYPYDYYKYPSTARIDEEKGELYLENEEKLYKYAFSGNEVIINIPKETKVSYDYTTGEPGITYYHVNYNNNSGWIIIEG